MIEWSSDQADMSICPSISGAKVAPVRSVDCAHVDHMHIPQHRACHSVNEHYPRTITVVLPWWLRPSFYKQWHVHIIDMGGFLLLYDQLDANMTFQDSTYIFLES